MSATTSWTHTDIASTNPVDLEFPARIRRGALIGVFAVLYGLSASGHWFPNPDSALYLMLGQNLAQSQGYVLWDAPHAFVPPGYPLLLAGMMTVGLGGMLWLNVMMIALGLGTLWLMDKALCELQPRATAAWIVAAVGLSHAMYLASVCQLSEVPFMFLVWGGTFGILRGLRTGSCALELGVLALVASCTVRLLGYPLAGGAALGLLWQPRIVRSRRAYVNAVIMLLALGLLAFVFYQSYQHAMSSQKQQSYHFWAEKLGGQSVLASTIQPITNLWQTQSEISRVFIGQEMPNFLAAILFGLPISIGMAHWWRRRQTLLVGMAVAYLGSIFILRPGDTRYLLPMAPLLLTWYLEGMRWLAARARWSPEAYKRLAIGCLLAFVLMNVPKNIFVAWHLRHDNFLALRDRWADLYSASDNLARAAQTGERFIASTDERGLSYLSGVPSTPINDGDYPSTSEALRKAADDGFRWLVMDRYHRDSRYDLLASALAEYTQAAEVFRNSHYILYDLAPPAATPTPVP